MSEGTKIVVTTNTDDRHTYQADGWTVTDITDLLVQVKTTGHPAETVAQYASGTWASVWVQGAKV